MFRDAGLLARLKVGVGLALQRRGDPKAAAEAALTVVERPELDGFWVHFDADVIDPGQLAAVDSPEPGGLTFEQVTAILTRLFESPRVAGLDVTIYDPDRDPGRRTPHRGTGGRADGDSAPAP